MKPGRKLSDKKLEIVISRLLLAGLLIAAVLVAVGGGFYLDQYGGERSDYGYFHSEPEDLKTLSGIFRSARELESRGVIQFGLILLIFTPVARVVFSAAAFLIRGEYFYAAVTVFVLTVLVFNLIHT